MKIKKAEYEAFSLRTAILFLLLVLSLTTLTVVLIIFATSRTEVFDQNTVSVSLTVSLDLKNGTSSQERTAIIGEVVSAFENLFTKFQYFPLMEKIKAPDSLNTRINLVFSMQGLHSTSGEALQSAVQRGAHSVKKTLSSSVLIQEVVLENTELIKTDLPGLPLQPSPTPSPPPPSSPSPPPPPPSLPTPPSPPPQSPFESIP